MQITIFSVWMTVLWSSILIIIFYFLRKKSILLDVCSVSGVLVLYLFCMIRLMIPIELPWTKEVSGGELYNKVYDMIRYEMPVGLGIHIYQVLLSIWIIGAIILLTRYFIQYFKLMRSLGKLSVVDNGKTAEILERVVKGNSKKPDIIKTSAINIPCCIGVFRKRIILPDKKLTDEEMYYILLHEYTHLQNNDVLTKMLINIICALYWWNPIVYLLRKDINQSIEIRCDGIVVSGENNISRSNYLAVMLSEFKDNCNTGEFAKYRKNIIPLYEEHSESLIERFQLVADGKNNVSFVGRILACVFALCLLICSYSFIIQSNYEVPIDDIEVDDKAYGVDNGNSYIIFRDGEYVLHSVEGDIVINKEAAEMMIQEGFQVKEEE